jgi:ABC-type transporter Mla subunit MlaD
VFQEFNQQGGYMDPAMQQLGIQLGEVAARNGAAGIADRIRTRKARKQDKETIADLEEIVNELVSDKSELVRIAQSFEQELVSQKISDADIAYIVDNIIPVLEQVMRAGSEGGEQSQVQEQLDLIRPILSAETVTIMQLIGFNYQKAIGEPLTTLVSNLIASISGGDPAMNQEIQRLALEGQNNLIKLAQDPKATARFNQLGS